ncbi:glycosyltransferase family 2 protein [Pelagicoccus sp. SDUM812003]|uniref:glycosyltransferase family 2 protein n=1 Tax=Pelagicoccus sp. SDUM812003 TaxID=3041267 RepID=UPI00280F5962|nr:glycosyltransferase family 2 protein [Pelagicoccus sp. SDUM812003]MDQ8204988.1 glycosyltransferase family 2 protein [Pelagicoccus sp. SDUM812003]
MPKVSIIIPAYNHANLISQTIDSVLNQTFTDYEIIVINDGSPDKTEEVLQPYIRQNLIIYKKQKNMGQSHARNIGLTIAKGEYIALLDDDDIWPQDKLEWQTRFLDENPNTGMVVGTCETIEETPKKYTTTESYSILSFESLLIQNPIISPGQTLARRDTLAKTGGFSPEIWGADDWDMYLKISKISTIVLSPKLGLHYRVHANNASKRLIPMLNNTIRVFEKHITSVPKERQTKTARLAYRWFYTFSIKPRTSLLKHLIRRGNTILSIKTTIEILNLLAALILNRNFLTWCILRRTKTELNSSTGITSTTPK